MRGLEERALVVVEEDFLQCLEVGLYRVLDCAYVTPAVAWVLAGALGNLP